MTPSGIDPATFRCVPQCLNHCATAYPNYRKYNLYIYIYICNIVPLQNSLKWSSFLHAASQSKNSFYLTNFIPPYNNPDCMSPSHGCLHCWINLIIQTNRYIRIQSSTTICIYVNGYMFQLHSHHQAYLQSLVELYMLNVYAMWDPSNEANIFTDGIKNMNRSVG
jgi:hypothetical protein